jgi:hypothetical protein
LVQRENLRGNIAHFYLAHIRYAEMPELERARLMTLRQFGNLMVKTDLHHIIDKLEKQLPALKEIFHPDYDIVFTEYTIFQSGREYRIDRLMLNTKAKTYRLIDFKTGGIYQPEQLNFYARLIQKLLKDDFKPAYPPQYISIDLD